MFHILPCSENNMLDGSKLQGCAVVLSSGKVPVFNMKNWATPICYSPGVAKAFLQPTKLTITVPINNGVQVCRYPPRVTDPLRG